MRLHQIRYVDDVAIYDWVWNILAALMVVAGSLLITRSRRAHRTEGDAAGAP